MNRTLFMSFLFVLVMAGCTPQNPQVQSESSQESVIETLEGMLVVQGTISLLQHEGETTTLESYAVDFEPFSGSRVRVSGQYSGDTLYVDEIEKL